MGPNTNERQLCHNTERLPVIFMSCNLHQKLNLSKLGRGTGGVAGVEWRGLGRCDGQGGANTLLRRECESGGIKGGGPT